MTQDIILFQRVFDTWEYIYTKGAETWKSRKPTHDEAKSQLRAMLGWDERRFNRAEFRRF